MTDKEKVTAMAKVLNNINKIIFAKSISLGSTEYFQIRDMIVNTLNNIDEKVE